MIPIKIKKICKKLHIRLTVKKGLKRIPKTKTVLLKQIKRKIKRNNFGVKENEKEKEKKLSFWQKHKRKIKYAAIAAAAAAGTYAAYKGHKHMTKEENKEKFKRYNSAINKLPSFKRNPKEDKNSKSIGTDPEPIESQYSTELKDLEERKRSLRAGLDEALSSEDDPTRRNMLRESNERALRELSEEKRHLDEHRTRSLEEKRNSEDRERERLERLKLERKGPLERLAEVTNQIQTLRENPIVGPLLSQAYNKAMEELPKLLEDNEKENEQQLSSAEEEYNQASLREQEINNRPEHTPEEEEEVRSKKEQAQQKLNDIKSRQKEYNQLVATLKNRQDNLSKVKNKNKAQQIVDEIQQLKEQIENFNKKGLETTKEPEGEEPENEEQESEETEQETKTGKPTKNRRMTTANGVNVGNKVKIGKKGKGKKVKGTSFGRNHKRKSKQIKISLKRLKKDLKKLKKV